MKIIKNFLTIFFIITINNSYALAENSTELYKKIQQITEDDTKKNVSDWLKNKIKDTFS